MAYKVLRISILILALAAALPSQAATLNLNFEEQVISATTSGPFAQDGPDFGVSQGFHFYRADGNAAGGWVDPKIVPAGAGGNLSDVALDWCGYCGGDGTVTMESTVGAVFDFDQLDFAVGDFTGGSVPTMVITGFLAAGGTVTTTVASPGTFLLWDSVILDSSWSSLNRVQFDITSTDTLAYIDNLVISNVVPIPAAAWMFASALGGLGFMRRWHAGRPLRPEERPVRS